MFRKLLGWFGGVTKRVRRCFGLVVGVVSVGIAGLCSGELFAQNTSMPIPLEAPNIAWDQLPTTLIGILTTPVVVGIAIALSIWVILKAMAFFKRAA